MRAEIRVRLTADGGEKFFGEGPHRLLRGVERLGSLRAAAAELGMAYSKANRIVRRAEEELGAPLTARRIGGADGGGSVLTPLAQEWLARYESFRADCEAAATASFAKRFGELPRPRLACAVLAAGRSRRFGGNKLLAELAGAPVLARTLEALPRECFHRIVAVTSAPAVSAICREKGVEVREYAGGPLSDSIREALAGLDDSDGCMFVNGDQPLLRAESLRRMAAAFAGNPKCAYRLACNGEAASPTIAPRAAYEKLRALTGEAGGMAALRAGWTICTVEAQDEAELWDVDDEEALRRAEEWTQNRI